MHSDLGMYYRAESNGNGKELSWPHIVEKSVYYIYKYIYFETVGMELRKRDFYF